MSDKKNDLTGILDLVKSDQESEEATPSSADVAPFLEEPKIEKIDEFESLEDFGKANPVTEESATFPVSTTDAEPALESDFQVSEPQLEVAADQPAADAEPLPEFVAPTPSPMDEVKRYAEQVPPSKDPVPAAYPFSVLITGALAPDEQARLLDLLSRENMGIREIDLEPQLISQKVLIPRISEYAAILIVSALRSSRAEIKMGPSDSIFSTEDTLDPFSGATPKIQQSSSADLSHPAERISITTESTLLGEPASSLQPIDTLTASATLKTHVVEAESSSEYQEILEALTRELKYKAYRKGASALVSFTVQLTALHLPTQYRLLLTGLAVKKTPSA